MIKEAGIFAIDFDPTVTPGLFGAVPNVVAVHTNGTIYVWVGPGDTDWRVLVPTDGAATTIIPYAPSANIAAGVTTYLGFGAANVNESLMNWVVPRAGTVRNLRVNVTTNTLLSPATYTVRRSASCNGAFAATAVAISVGAGVTGCFVSSNSQTVAPGDRISLEVSAGGAVGIVEATAGLEAA